MSNIIMSAKFMAKAKAAKSFEELKSMIAAVGVEASDDELMAKWEGYSGTAKKFKLSEEELDNVAGGCGETPEELAGCSLTGVTIISDDGRVWEGVSREPKCCPICASSVSFISAFGGRPTSWKYYICSDGGHLLCYSNGQ